MGSISQKPEAARQAQAHGLAEAVLARCSS